MLNKLVRHKVRIALTILLIVMLALIRAYEDSLFYDPFLNFFKTNYNGLPLPEYNATFLFLGILFRYALNTLLSLGIIYLLFKEISMIKFASILYVIFFLFLLIAYFLVLYTYNSNNNLVLFYIRRFLIQPIFVILFIPAFYFQKTVSKK